MDTESNNSGNGSLLNNAPQALVLPEIHAIGRPTRKRSGEAAEAAFLAKASGLGFAVAKPWGDSERYDFILDAGHGLLRVQVKSTQRYAESRYRVKAAGWKDTYTLDEIDFLVAYIIPEDLWYVVPIAAFAPRTGLRFYPHGGRNAQYEQYREAWCLMTVPFGAGAPARELPKLCRRPELATRCAICPVA
jgi:PD-(D/E)XK endonuclease